MKKVQFVVVNGIPGVLYGSAADAFADVETMEQYAYAYDLVDEKRAGKPTVALAIVEDLARKPESLGYLGTVALKDELCSFPMNVSVTGFETTGEFDLDEVRERLGRCGGTMGVAEDRKPEPALQKAKVAVVPAVAEEAVAPLTPCETIAVVCDEALRTVCDEIRMIDLAKGTFAGQRMDSLKFREALTEMVVCAFAAVRFTAATTLGEE